MLSCSLLLFLKMRSCCCSLFAVSNVPIRKTVFTFCYRVLLINTRFTMFAGLFCVAYNGVVMPLKVCLSFMRLARRVKIDVLAICSTGACQISAQSGNA